MTPSFKDVDNIVRFKGIKDGMAFPIFSGSTVVPAYIAEPLFSIFPVSNVQLVKVAVPLLVTV